MPTVSTLGVTSQLRVLAHQGGWDEIGMVAVPIAIFAALLWMANRRATRDQADRTARSSEAEEDDTRL